MSQPSTPTTADRTGLATIFMASGAVLLVMALTSFLGSDLAGSFARSTGGDGAGGGDVGQVKLYLQSIAQGLMLALGLVLAAGGVSSLVAAAVLRRADRR